MSGLIDPARWRASSPDPRVDRRSWRAPVHDGDELRPIAPEHHVREVIVSVQDSRLRSRWPVFSEPTVDLLDPGQPGLARPAFIGGVFPELGAPARRLPLEETVGLAEIAKSGGEMIHTPQRSKPVGEGDAHVMADLGRVRMKCGQADIGVEAVHRLHEIEGGAEYVIRGADANEARVGTSVPASAESTRASRRMVALPSI